MYRFALALVLLIPSVGWAADIPLRWTGVNDASGYKVTQTADAGATWVEVADVPHNGSVALDEQTTTVLGAPDSGLLLFRVSAYNSVGETIRVESGAWYNGDWNLPDTPSGLGIP